MIKHVYFILLFLILVSPSYAPANQDQSFYAEVARLFVRNYKISLKSITNVIKKTTKNPDELLEADLAICLLIGESGSRSSEIRPNLNSLANTLPDKPTEREELKDNANEIEFTRIDMWGFCSKNKANGYRDRKFLEEKIAITQQQADKLILLLEKYIQPSP